MSWLTEWKAISAQIEGLYEAARFYVESNGPSQKDINSVANRRLIPQINKIFDDLEGFRATHRESIPPAASDSLAVLPLTKKKLVPKPESIDGFVYVHITVTLLISFRAEFEYHISDTEFVAKRLSERAFDHLQRSIVVDSELQRKWIAAFKENEPACERLGGVHLLLHGIWAFKIDAKGEKTDLVFSEPILESSSIERSAEALVLTEWKRVLSPIKTEAIANKAREQVAKYTGGALGGVELARYRFIVLVSEDRLKLPDDHSQNGVVYRHVNVAVAPKSPSKG
jgi:hypothetical protein